MSWAEVKKINGNLSIPLDELLMNLFGAGFREYIYATRTYTVPMSGIYTIRAYCGTYGSYGKVVKQFTKGEILTITITGTTQVTITSNLQGTSVFHINLTQHSYVNGNSVDGIKAIAIGGSGDGIAGGNAYVRCNNGIAAGGGGSGANSDDSSGFAGGTAYAYGVNVYALGGGGGGAGSENVNAVGAGGGAYINGTSITTYCSSNKTTLTSGKGYAGGKGYVYSSANYRGGSGGNGGCGGGAGYRCFNTASNGNALTTQAGGAGYFSYGGCPNGGSARGGDMISAGSLYIGVPAAFVSPAGYFVGGKGAYLKAGGEGGFLGGRGASASNTEASTTGGAGGYSPYGIGGAGGDVESRYQNIAAYGGKGGDGKICGGEGGAATYGRTSTSNSTANHTGGTGGNGFYPGRGGKGVVTNGDDGMAITNNMLIGTAPLKTMTSTTSIVIIEYGNSPEDF